MALPKINAHPKYEMVIPSSKEKVRFRPFLVKEEKVLMIAMESNDVTFNCRYIRCLYRRWC
jgi:hypothetical protein